MRLNGFNKTCPESEKMKEKLTLAKYKEKQTTPLRQATLCFLIRGDEVLLAMKKRGFGAGMWNGSGGKVTWQDKNIEETVIRETNEEIGVTLKNLEHVATFNFYFPKKTGWGQQVWVYLSREWDGEPKETEEMAPKWFDKNEIPYDQMWEDDRDWLPQVLDGMKLQGDFLFDKNQKIVEQMISIIT